MATLLNDTEIKGLLGKVIVDGDPSCVRLNGYVLRLGSVGEFINTGKEFEIGSKKKGVRIQPGHSVGVTAFETLDFRRETVHQIYPGHDLHAFISPPYHRSLSRKESSHHPLRPMPDIAVRSTGPSPIHQAKNDDSSIRNEFID